MQLSHVKWRGSQSSRGLMDLSSQPPRLHVVKHPSLLRRWQIVSELSASTTSLLRDVQSRMDPKGSKSVLTLSFRLSRVSAASTYNAPIFLRGDFHLRYHGVQNFAPLPRALHGWRTVFASEAIWTLLGKCLYLVACVGPCRWRCNSDGEVERIFQDP